MNTGFCIPGVEKRHSCLQESPRTSASSHRRYEKDFFLNIGKPEKQEKYLKKFRTVSEKPLETMAKMEALTKDSPYLPEMLLEHIESCRSSYNKYISVFLALADKILTDTTITPQQGNKAMGPFKEHIYKFVEEVDFIKKEAKVNSEQAVEKSTAASADMNKLGQAADKINKVTEAITEISEQTNLLALNATIEAARAGEVGKGLAVVANEIKELARQTADATVDIKNQIGEMQATTDSSIKDMEEISTIISKINNVIITVAAAVEQQSATSAEISQNISQASSGITEVNQNISQSSVVINDISGEISELSVSAGVVHTSSSKVNTNADDLEKLSGQLRRLIEQFKIA